MGMSVAGEMTSVTLNAYCTFRDLGWLGLILQMEFVLGVYEQTEVYPCTVLGP